MTRWETVAVFALLATSACGGGNGGTTPDPAPAPPFGGTIFLDPDIITPADSTTYLGLTYVGQGTRTMFDRRANDWVVLDPFLFDATYADGLSVEVQVNPEFGTPAEAQVEAQYYAEVVGRLPYALRVDVETMWIHQGVEPFGGGNDNLLVHTGQGALYDDQGILEETFVHEAAHTSLDASYAASAGWRAARAADPTFISTYARDFPDREDVAESFLPYLAIRYRADRISASLRETILTTIPSRIAFFDSLGLDLDPVR